MLLLIIFMLSGIILGYILRKNNRAILFAEKISTVFICILLLCLGISFGKNKEVLNNLTKFGLDAIIISLSGIIGSIIVSYLVYKYLFKEKENEE